MKYYHDTSEAYAIEFCHGEKFEKPVQLADFTPSLSRPPQSFAYIA